MTAHGVRKGHASIAEMVLASPIFDIAVTNISGQTTTIDAYRGQVLLIVNVASRCGYTPQYRALESLYRRYHKDGLVVLGFPCNQFGRQEPGTEAEILDFCDREYDVTFPLFRKIEVNGSGVHPLYQFLKSQKKGLFGAAIKWNFTKFLVGRDGTVLARYGPGDRPESIEHAILNALQS
jgi:glutathione peroxidase